VTSGKQNQSRLRENLREYSEDPPLLYWVIYCMYNGHVRTMEYTLWTYVWPAGGSEVSDFGVWRWLP
jgi:hypothetical protein